MDAIALRPTPSRGVATREALLDAAESLIAEHGFKTPSHRMIAGSAGAHVALVSYHFGTKELLFEATVERRAGRLVARWRAALDALAAGPTRTAEDVLHAWWQPFADLEALQETAWRNYLCGIARLASAHDGEEWYQRYFGAMDRSFRLALAATLPACDAQAIDAGFRYGRTLLSEVLLHRCGRYGGMCIPRGFREADTKLLIVFIGSGMRAMAPGACAAAD